MALTFDQGAKLTQDASFIQRVTMAMVRAAAEIFSEDVSSMSTTIAAKRHMLANRILESPTVMVNAFVYMVASDPATALTWWDPTGVTASTDADPVTVTTALAHGFTTGDVVEILNHAGNTPANGTHIVTVVDATNFTIPVPGIAAGTGGTAQKMISDGDLAYTVNSLFNAAAGILPGD